MAAAASSVNEYLRIVVPPGRYGAANVSPMVSVMIAHYSSFNACRQVEKADLRGAWHFGNGLSGGPRMENRTS